MLLVSIWNVNLICCENQVTGFNMKCKAVMKWDNAIKMSYKAVQSFFSLLHFKLLLTRPYQLEQHAWIIGSAEFEAKFLVLLFNQFYFFCYSLYPV